jgi:hypothetical protein
VAAAWRNNETAAASMSKWRHQRNGWRQENINGETMAIIGSIPAIIGESGNGSMSK